MDILDELRVLHEQATSERSHYYAGSVVRKAIAEIEAMRGKWGSGRVARFTIKNPHKRKDIELEINGSPITLDSGCEIYFALADKDVMLATSTTKEKS